LGWMAGVWLPAEARYFTLLHSIQTGLLSNGYWGALSPGVKRPRHEADHSPTLSLCQAQEWWSHTSTSPYIFMVWSFLIKHSDNFTLHYQVYNLCYLNFQIFSPTHYSYSYKNGVSRGGEKKNYCGFISLGLQFSTKETLYCVWKGTINKMSIS
jgi:hypothetical protein